MSPNASHRVRPGLSSAASLITTLLISFDQVVLNQHLSLVPPEYPFFESPCLAAREDHIAPARSVFLGAQVLGGPVRFVVSGSGHIAGVVNPPARKRYQHWTGGPPVGELAIWLEAAEEHPGSWWPDWQAWSEAQDKRRVPAREIGGGKLLPIEDAPGSYVQVRS